MNPSQPSHLTPPCPYPVLLGAVIAGSYHLTGVIHTGLYYTVYIVKDLHNETEYAAKVCMESMATTTSLSNENEIYRALHSGPNAMGIPKIHYFHSQGNYTALIMDRFGSALQSRFSHNPLLLPLPLTLRVGIDVIRTLAGVHSQGFLHLDINPNNILFDYSSDSLIVRLVDFRLAERFRSSETGEHRCLRRDYGAIGSIRFASVRTHGQLTRSRVDDLESLAYVLIYVHKGILPWDACIKKETEGNEALQHGMDPGIQFRNAVFDSVGIIKSNTSVRELCLGMPPEVAEYVRYVRGLEFPAMPYYEYLMKLLEVALRRETGSI